MTLTGDSVSVRRLFASLSRAHRAVQKCLDTQTRRLLNFLPSYRRSYPIQNHRVSKRFDGLARALDLPFSCSCAMGKYALQNVILELTFFAALVQFAAPSRTKLGNQVFVVGKRPLRG